MIFITQPGSKLTIVTLLKSSLFLYNCNLYLTSCPNKCHIYVYFGNKYAILKIHSSKLIIFVALNYAKPSPHYTKIDKLLSMSILMDFLRRNRRLFRRRCDKKIVIIKLVFALRAQMFEWIQETLAK